MNIEELLKKYSRAELNDAIAIMQREAKEVAEKTYFVWWNNVSEQRTERLNHWRSVQSAISDIAKALKAEVRR